MTSSNVIWTKVKDVLKATRKRSATDIRVSLTNEAGEPFGTFPLLDVLQYEHAANGQRFLRIAGRWFLANDEFVEQVNRRIQQIPRIDAELQLPRWNPTTHSEAQYNTEVASSKGWLLQDQKFLYRMGSTVEACNLLTPDGHFIHVKRADSLAALEEMRRRFQKEWPTKALDKLHLRFVAAVARPDATRNLLGKMLVAKVNLLQHAAECVHTTSTSRWLASNLASNRRHGATHNGPNGI